MAGLAAIHLVYKYRITAGGSSRIQRSTGKEEAAAETTWYPKQPKQQQPKKQSQAGVGLSRILS